VIRWGIHIRDDAIEGSQIGSGTRASIVLHPGALVGDDANGIPPATKDPKDTVADATTEANDHRGEVLRWAVASVFTGNG
jgi:hypothetical protein